jgi:predicted nucleic acid-binding protein
VILVDSNILIDIFTNDPRWMRWSRMSVEAATATERTVVNQVVVAEVAPRFASLQLFVDRLNLAEVEFADLSNDAAYCAGLAFLEYRRRKKSDMETTRSIIADFLIGGHAEFEDAAILTRDPRFYRTYFPSVRLITPDKADR